MQITAIFMYSATIDIKLVGLERFETEIKQQLNGKAGPVSNAIELWAVRYRSFLQQRFDTFSRGGGTWQPLKESTLRNRRQPKRKVVSKTAILRDTGTLFTALTPVFVGSPGALHKRIPYGVQVGYGGNRRYIDDRGKPAKATIADIAAFHQDGSLPRLPKREIIVDPPMSLLRTMAKDMEKAMQDVAKGITS